LKITVLDRWREKSNENRRREPHFLIYPPLQFGNESFLLQSLQNYFVRCLPEHSAGHIAPSLQSSAPAVGVSEDSFRSWEKTVKQGSD